MYLSYQIQQMRAAETMTAAAQRQADEQVGRLAADLSWLSQRIAGRVRVPGRPLLAGRRYVTAFRNDAFESSADNATTIRCQTSGGAPTPLRNPAGNR